MIIVKLQGGLGNQMFQYALGRQLSYKFNTTLKLDISGLSDRTARENFPLRDYELEIYNIQAQIATKDDIASFIPNQTLFDRALKKIKKKAGLIKIKSEIEQTFRPSVLTLGPNTYLTGYWQSEKYFLPISNLIRSNFTLKTNLLREIDQKTVLREYKESIINTNSVSVHFRRCDYVNDFVTNKYHGICSEDYYRKAITQINLKIANPYYFLFSDETEWLEKNFKSDQPYSIIQGNSGYIDLHLMSLCKHNIIANSSFSWWGAWLNTNPEKTIIAPKNWFVNKEMNNQTYDLIPNKWIRL